MAQEYRPGKIVPQSGIYTITHHPAHADMLHEAIVIKGDEGRRRRKLVARKRRRHGPLMAPACGPTMIQAVLCAATLFASYPAK
jgi:hypothetical protein